PLRRPRLAHRPASLLPYRLQRGSSLPYTTLFRFVSRPTGYEPDVIDRKDLGSRMEGAPGDPGYVRRSALGLPAHGPAAGAPIWRPLLTLTVDRALSVGSAMLLFNYHELAVLGTFVVLNLLCISLFGATPAQFLLRVRVLPVRGRSPMPLRALVRTVLILLIIPSVVWNRDAQPLQDVVAGT